MTAVDACVPGGGVVIGGVVIGGGETLSSVEASALDEASPSVSLFSFPGALPAWTRWGQDCDEATPAAAPCDGVL